MQIPGILVRRWRGLLDRTQRRQSNRYPSFDSTFLSCVTNQLLVSISRSRQRCRAYIELDVVLPLTREFPEEPRATRAMLTYAPSRCGSDAGLEGPLDFEVWSRKSPKKPSGP